MIRFTGLLLCALATPCFATLTNEQENNDVESRANGPVTAANAVHGSLSTRRDVDWFWFDLPAPGLIDISLDHGGANDFDWALYAATGPALASGATRAIPETGSYRASSAGRYLVKLSAYRGSGSYRLDVSFDSGGGGISDPRPAKPSSLQNWITGNPADSGRQPQGGPGLLLMGGGTDVDQAFVQRAYPIANGGDVVVLRTTGSNGYNDYLYNLASGALKPDSVETLLVDTRAKADSDYVEWVVRNAELIFIAGGDQSTYVNAWQDTRLEAAIRAAHARGAVIGGTSAGMAVQGRYLYDPDNVTAATSAEAVANPYRSSMLFSQELLGLPPLQHVVTDSHFRQRDRMGRLLAFMARLRQDGTAGRITGVGIDEATALFINRDGVGVVDGSGAAYVIEERSDTSRTQVVPGQPLVYRNLQRIRLLSGNRYDFSGGSHDGQSILLSVDGRNATPLDPANPY